MRYCPPFQISFTLGEILKVSQKPVSTIIHGMGVHNEGDRRYNQAHFQKCKTLRRLPRCNKNLIWITHIPLIRFSDK